MAGAKVVEAVHAQGYRKMAVEERQGVEHELAELKDQLKVTEESPEKTAANPSLLQMIPQIRRRIQELEELLNKDEDLVAKGDDRTVLDKRRKEIEATIKKEMPSEREQHLKASVHAQDFERAVQKTVFHQQKYGDLIREWQEIMRRLEPEDPSACNVNRLL